MTIDELKAASDRMITEAPVDPFTRGVVYGVWVSRYYCDAGLALGFDIAHTELQRVWDALSKPTTRIKNAD